MRPWTVGKDGIMNPSNTSIDGVKWSTLRTWKASAIELVANAWDPRLNATTFEASFMNQQ